MTCRSFVLVLSLGVPLSLSITPSLLAQSAGQASHCVVVSEGAPALPAKLLEGQGTVHFPITTSSAEAAKFFDQGVAQMHSFWAREAERSFLQAAALDPEAPMPWWGVAMVAAGDFRPHFQLVRDKHLPGSLPSAPNEKRALAAARRARELASAPGKATPLEKLYIESIWARRDPNTVDSDAAYIAGLRAIITQNPKEIEARTYLALHLMDGFVLPSHKPRPGSTEAVALLRELVREAPAHPGVHHFIIHGWEGSSFARDAWESCRQYTELVPNIPHALHMPGHIYAQTGKLNEARQSFTDAAALERKYMAADKEYGSGHHGHNVHFLSLVYAAAGKYDDALASATELLGFTESPKERQNPDAYRTAYRQGWFAMLRTLAWAERWDEILGDSRLPVLETPREQFWLHWARGLAQAARKNPGGAVEELKAMRVAEAAFVKKVGKAAPQEFAVALQELQGHITLAKGDRKRGLKILGDASRAERALRYNEPPVYPRPIAEAWGLAAQRAGDHEEARKAFQIALEQLPESQIAKDGIRQLMTRKFSSNEPGQ